MSVDRIILNQGNNTIKSKKRDIVKLEYTSYLYEEFKNANYYWGKQYVVRIALTNN